MKAYTKDAIDNNIIRIFAYIRKVNSLYTVCNCLIKIHFRFVNGWLFITDNNIGIYIDTIKQIGNYEAVTCIFAIAAKYCNTAVCKAFAKNFAYFFKAGSSCIKHKPRLGRIGFKCAFFNCFYLLCR